MKSVRLFLFFLPGLVSHYGALGRTTHHKTKNDDHYNVAENDISDDAPILPVEGGYYHPDEVHDDFSNEELANLYDMRRLYGTDGVYDLGSPYYYYMGSYFDGNVYPQNYASQSYYAQNEDTEYNPNESIIDELPAGSIISESQGVPLGGPVEETGDDEESQEYEEIEEPEGRSVPDVPDIAEENGEPENYEEEQPQEIYDPVERSPIQSRPVPYWVPSDSDMINNPYMMGIPAQLQTFPMFDPKYYRTEYDDYARYIAEEEQKEREELEERARDHNTVENPQNFPRGGHRVRRGFAKALNLRNKDADESSAYTHRKGFRTHQQKENVVLNADCRGGGGGGRRQNPNAGGNGDGGATDAAANGLDGVAGAAGDAAGAASGAAGDAVNTAADAVENLRLGNTRRSRQRTRNNGRSVQ